MCSKSPPKMMVFLAAGLMILLVACGGGSGPDIGTPQLQLNLPSAQLVVGESLQAEVHLHGFPLSTTGVTDLRWSSDKPEIATVDGTGRITGAEVGTTIIRVSSTASGSSVRDGYATISVHAGPRVNPDSSRPPVIAAFSAEGAFRAGTALELNWSVQDATSVTLELEQESDGQWTEVFQSDAKSSGTTVQLPLHTPLLNFRLTAVNDIGKQTSQLLGPAQPVSGWICSEPEQQIEITDPVVEAHVRTLYGLAAGPLFCGDVQRPIESRLLHEDSTPQETENMLNLNGLMETTSLEGIQHLVYLSRLELMHNDLIDIHPLHGLTRLTELNLDVNHVSDLSPLAGLTRLQVLGLYQNDLTDLRPLHGLTDLRILYLSENGIHDLTPLKDLTKLEHLWLFQNCRVSSRDEAIRPRDCLRDLNPIAGLHSLRSLLIKGNEITSISAVAGLANLELLEAGDNLITDVGPLAHLDKLRTVTLDDNPVGFLASLTNSVGFPAGEPFTFKRGIAKLPIGPAYPNLGLGYNCILDDPHWESGLSILRERGTVVRGEDLLQNIRDECAVEAENTAAFEGQDVRLLLRHLQRQDFLQQRKRKP